MPRVSRCQRIIIRPESRGFEATVAQLPSTSTIAAKLIRCHKDPKEVIKILCRWRFAVHKKIQSGTPQGAYRAMR